MRRTFETANLWLTKLLRVRKGTLVSRYVQLYNAFFISALIHHVGALNLPYSSLVWSQFYFFMMQPIAITIEDLAIYLGKKVGLTKTCRLPRAPIFDSRSRPDLPAGKTKAAGYVWVGCVLSFTLRYAIKAFVDAGLCSMRHPFVAKFSIMERLFA